MFNSTFQIVMQGPIYPCTNDYILQYVSYPFVEKLIVSCWDGDVPVIEHPKVVVIRSDINSIKTRGGFNVNLQLHTSKVGFNLVTSKISMKIRSDFLIHGEDLEEFLPYFYKINNNNPIDKIFSFSFIPPQAFQINDMFAFGYTKDLINLYNIPLSYQSNTTRNTTISIVPEGYIAANYIANFEPEVKELCKDPEKYLFLHRPDYIKSQHLSNKYTLKYFHIFPPIRYKFTKTDVIDFENKPKSNLW